MKFVAVEERFLPKIMKWRNEQMRILRQNKLLTPADQKRWFENINENQKVWAITNFGELIGYCGLTNLDLVNKRAEVSILFSKGYTKSRRFNNSFEIALKHLCNYGFDTLQLHRIVAEVFEFRKAVINVMQQNKFKIEGVLRDHIWKTVKGTSRTYKFYDSIIMGRLHND